MTKLIGGLIVLLLPVVLHAQTTPQPTPAQQQASQAVLRAFEAGQHQQVIDAANPDATPDIVYAAAQSYLKLTDTEQAVRSFARLAALPANDPWHFIGMSARQLVEDQPEPAIASARQGVALAEAGTMARTAASAHYQLGLALARLERWPEAAAAFDTAAQRDPLSAYPHYYGGLMYSRAGRADQMAIHFDQFLKMAPEAPERPEVLSIMRTIRRR